MGKAAKGGDFEREICKKLSTWWTADLPGGPRDDVFWRSSQSGGRATERAKQGKTTYGSYGDIAVVDPIGTPLIKLFTIELKRGSTYGYPADLLEAPPSKALRPFEGALCQAIRSHEMAGSLGWLLICRRDHKVAMVYADLLVMRRFTEVPGLFKTPCIRYSLAINQLDSPSQRHVRFVSWRLDDFLARLKPKQIMELTCAT